MGDLVGICFKASMSTFDTVREIRLSMMGTPPENEPLFLGVFNSWPFHCSADLGRRRTNSFGVA